jgi:hypothetical protein
MKVAVGDRVSSSAVDVMGKAAAIFFGQAAGKQQVLFGTIVRSEGTKRAIKWFVEWEDQRAKPSCHSSRSLSKVVAISLLMVRAPALSQDITLESAPANAAHTPGATVADALLMLLSEARALGPELEEPAAAQSSPVPPATSQQPLLKPTLLVKGVQWSVDPNLVDPRAHLVPQRAWLLWHESAKIVATRERHAIDYFMWSFPRSAISGILKRTTDSMQSTNYKIPALTKGEFFRVLGSLLALTRTRQRRCDLFEMTDVSIVILFSGKQYIYMRIKFILILNISENNLLHRRICDAYISGGA